MNEVAPEIEKIALSTAQRHGINKYEISDVHFNKKGEGFLGEICFFTISDKASGKKLHLVTKTAFKDDKIRDLIPIRLIFKNEITFYTVVYPRLISFAKSTGLTVQELVPQCVNTSMDNCAESLVLQNLKYDGFELLDKSAFLSDQHLTKIFQTYGIFHGYSLAYMDQRPDEFNEICSAMHGVMEDFLNGTFPVALVQICKKVSTMLDSNLPKDVLNNFDKFLADPVQIFRDSLQADKYSVITHGDCWSNNMMFKYKASNNSKDVEDIRLLDWQLTRRGSPVCDLSYCFYSGATKTDLDKLDDYLKIYHDSLSTTIRQLGSNPDQLYPFTVLKGQWKTYSRYGLLMGFMILKIKLTKQENVVDLKDEDLDDINHENSAFISAECDEVKFKEMVTNLVMHMDEIGAL